jgi:hypothetical protein
MFTGASWCVYDIFGREIIECTVIYGVLYGSGQPYLYANDQGRSKPKRIATDGFSMNIC